MGTAEIVKELCKKKGITIAKLERDLGFGNGTIVKSASAMRADRLKAIADYFGVSMEFLLTGNDETFEESSDKLEVELGYLYYCLKEMEYYGDFEDDNFVIESFDKKEKCILSNDEYVLMTALMKEIDKALILKFLKK